MRLSQNLTAVKKNQLFSILMNEIEVILNTWENNYVSIYLQIAHFFLIVTFQINFMLIMYITMDTWKI